MKEHVFSDIYIFDQTDQHKHENSQTISNDVVISWDRRHL